MIVYIFRLNVEEWDIGIYEVLREIKRLVILVKDKYEKDYKKIL